MSRTGRELINAMPSVKLPDYAPPPAYSIAEPGMDLYTHTAVLMLASIASIHSNSIFTEDELAEKACKLTEALLRKLP